MESNIRSFWRYFKRNRLAVGGMAVILLTFIIAGSASFIAPQDPGKTDVSLKLKSPSLEHYLGTDQLGRDVFSRMLHGAKVSLSVGFVAVAISISLGYSWERWQDTTEDGSIPS